MMKPFLLRGALAGVAGALATVATLLLLGEQAVNEAIAIEEANAMAAGEVSEPLYSRTVQIIGGSLGIALFGIFAGIVFGVVFAAVRHRLGDGPDWRRARRLGALAFVAAYLVPVLKYPANPPAVGNPETINHRTLLFGCMLAISVLALVLSGRALAWFRRLGWADHVVGPAAVALWAVIVGAAYVVLPSSPDVIEAPADLIWRFRLASAGGQLAFWVVTAVVYGWLCVAATGQKVFARTRSDAATPATPPSGVRP